MSEPHPRCGTCGELFNDNCSECRKKLLDWYDNQLAALTAELDGYKAAAEDHRRLVRELDVLMNGADFAAKQASLCDIVAQFPKWLEGLTAERDKWKAARDECERQFQEKVAEISQLMDDADKLTAERDAAQAKLALLESSDMELVRLRGYEQGVIQMRKDLLPIKAERDALKAEVNGFNTALEANRESHGKAILAYAKELASLKEGFNEVYADYLCARNNRDTAVKALTEAGFTQVIGTEITWKPPVAHEFGDIYRRLITAEEERDEALKDRDECDDELQRVIMECHGSFAHKHVAEAKLARMRDLYGRFLNQLQDDGVTISPAAQAIHQQMTAQGGSSDV